MKSQHYKFGFTLAEGTPCIDPLQRITQRAFTLAEVLITLGIIGVVAALTIPTLMDNINSILSKHRQSVIEKRLLDGLNRFSTQEDGLSQYYPTTYDFLTKFSKYHKMSQICRANEITNCIPYSKIYYEDDGETQSKDVSTLTSIDSFMSNGAEKYLEPASFITAQGIPMIMALKKNCAWDTGKAMRDVNDSGCIAYMYDESGTRLPNKIGKDWILHGLTVKDFYFAKIGGVKIMEKAFYPNKLSAAQCKYEITRNYGISFCESYYNGGDNNYWAWAMKYCHDKGWRLPTLSEGESIVEGLYKPDPYYSGRTKIIDSTITASIGLKDTSGSNTIANAYLWTSEQNHQYATMMFIHSKNYSHDSQWHTQNYPTQAICVSD